MTTWTLEDHARSFLDEPDEILAAVSRVFTASLPELTQHTPEDRLLIATYLVGLVYRANQDGCAAAESAGRFLSGAAA